MLVKNYYKALYQKKKRYLPALRQGKGGHRILECVFHCVCACLGWVVRFDGIERLKRCYTVF